MLLGLVLLPCIANMSGGKPTEFASLSIFLQKKAKAGLYKVLTRYYAAFRGFMLPQVSLCLKTVINLN